MESFGNKRIIQQGENFNLDLKLSQSDVEYIPYIIGKRENPHFVVTVASTKFEKRNRYVESWWLKIDPETTPMFKQTVPQYIGVLPAIPITINDVAEYVITDEIIDEPLLCLYQYKLVGEDDYRYFYYDQENPTTTTVLKHDYECSVKLNIETGIFKDGKMQEGTGEWGSQNYMYQITLVSGQEMIDTLLDAKQAYPDLDWRADWPVKLDDETDNDYRQRFADWLAETTDLNKTVQENVFNFIKARKPDFFQADIDWDSALGRIWCPEPILTPELLQVNNNLRVLI